MIRRILPSPLLTLALIVMWLVLNQSLSPGQIILGVIVGVAAPGLLASLRPARPRIRHPWILIRLILNVGKDVIQSNLDVFRTLLRTSSEPVHSRFIEIPLELRDPNALASLAMITTVVPGTVWCELARDSSTVLLHAWNAPDPDAFVAMYKQRYERPLIQIFESAP